MNYRLNSRVLGLVFKILVLFAIAKIIGLAIYIYLPKNGIDTTKDDKLINLNSYASAFASKGETITQTAISTSDIKLIAVYKETEGTDGYAVIKENNEVKILKNDDSFGQYRLKEIKSDGIFLDNSGTDLWLGFAKSTLNTAAQIQISPSLAATGASLLARDMKLEREASMNATGQEYSNVIQKSELDSFLNNPDSVFKNIGFKEVMKNGKLEGFRVLSVNRNSPFAKLGLRAGDIITSFNGIKLDNYSSVLEIYNNAKTYTRVKIEVMRNNEKKDFEYEIY
ncbi:MAG: PDZ domain-containing protein [Campylobacteraceae bacterium]|jgi:type II secretion system protein C|nr:PDZ domain-containing protein [Campylobacteraceae bacterium]